MKKDLMLKKFVCTVLLILLLFIQSGCKKKNDSANPTSGGGGGTTIAKDILGGLTNWKLNAYTGILNIGITNNGLTYLDEAPKNDNTSWFYGANGFNIVKY